MDILFETYPTLQGDLIGVATLNAEKSLNALSLPMAHALLTQLQRWEQAPEIACVLLKSNGERAFCAGADVRHLAEACQKQPSEVPERCIQFFTTEYQLDFLLHGFAKPLIAWAQGYVLGGGMGLLQGAGLRIVTPDARLGMPEINIGLYPDAGASWFLYRLPERLGLFLGLTGTQLNAADALAYGLADYCLTHKQQSDLLEGLTHLNWHQQPQLQLHSLLHTLTHNQPSHPEPQLQPLIPEIREFMAVPDLQQTWHTLVQQQDHANPLLASAAQTLAAGCPLTAHLIWKQSQWARYLSLAQAFQMEYWMSLNCCRYPEFREGVQARLVDKRPPQWHWSCLEQVPEIVVDTHFKPIATMGKEYEMPHFESVPRAPYLIR